MVKYRANIFHGIVTLLIEKEGLIYTDLYRKLVSYLGTSLSHRDFSSHLQKMKEDKILYARKIKGKAVPEYYSLTENAKKLYELNILGIGRKYEKRLSLYQLIIYFEAYKRGHILTRGQTGRFLRKFDSSWDKLTKIDFSKIDTISGINAYFDPVAEIEIRELSSNRFGTKSATPLFYALSLGFSANEFISYIRKLKKGQEPRPFSKLPSLVPFVHFVRYTDTEVDEAIELLAKANLLRPITHTGNKRAERFRLTDKQLIQFIHQIRIIERVYFYKTIMKIAFVEKPSENEKDDISYYFGERRAGHVIAFLNDQRKNYFKALTKRKLEDYRREVTRLCRSIDKMSLSCRKQNQQILKDEYLAELFLPFVLTASTA